MVSSPPRKRQASGDRRREIEVVELSSDSESSMEHYDDSDEELDRENREQQVDFELDGLKLTEREQLDLAMERSWQEHLASMPSTSSSAGRPQPPPPSPPLLEQGMHRGGFFHEGVSMGRGIFSKQEHAGYGQSDDVCDVKWGESWRKDSAGSGDSYNAVPPPASLLAGVHTPTIHHPGSDSINNNNTSTAAAAAGLLSMTSDPRRGVSIGINSNFVTSQRAAIPRESVGHRLLSNMGWREGEKLGKSGTGLAEPLVAEERKRVGNHSASREGLGLWSHCMEGGELKKLDSERGLLFRSAETGDAVVVGFERKGGNIVRTRGRATDDSEWLISPEEKDKLPRYLICQTQRNRAVGICVNLDVHHGAYKSLAFGEGLKETWPPQAEYKIGQEWWVRETTARKDKWAEVMQRIGWFERKTGAFKRDGVAEEETMLNEEGEEVQPIIWQENINFTAVADGHKLVKSPCSRKVVGVVVDKTETTLHVQAQHLLREARIEDWNLVGTEVSQIQPGDLLELQLSHLPPRMWVGKRYIFPPHLGWHPIDTLTGDDVWMVAHAKRTSPGLVAEHVKGIEALFAANVKAMVEEEEKRIEASHIACVPLPIPNVGPYVFELYRAKAESTAEFSRLLAAWQEGESIEVRKNRSDEYPARGKVLRVSHRRVGQQREISVLIRLYEDEIVQRMWRDGQGDGRQRVAVSSPSTVVLRAMEHDLDAGWISTVAERDTPQGLIMRKVLGLADQNDFHCTIANHMSRLSDSQRPLTEEQHTVANAFNCNCTRGNVIVARAGAGTGKSHTIAAMVMELVMKQEDVRVAVVCTINEGLIGLVSKILRRKREYGGREPVISIVLSRTAQEELGDKMAELGLADYVDTMVYDKEGKLRYAVRADVLRTLDEKDPQIIFCTFDLAILCPPLLRRTTHLAGDEVGRLPQASAAAIIAHLPRLRTIHLTADDQQFGVYDANFPPHFSEWEGARCGFHSILKRLTQPRVQRVFKVVYSHSYRAHPALTAAFSKIFYDDVLRAGIPEGERMGLLQAQGFNLPVRDFPAILIHNEVEQRRLPNSTSYYNMREIWTARRIFEALVNCMPRNTTFYFLCYYKDAREETRRVFYDMLPKRLHNRYTVCTVDEFMGGEGDIIFLLLTRSDAMLDEKFLHADDRCVVAFTRARHGLIVIGNMLAYTRSTGYTARIIRQLSQHTPIVGDSYWEVATGQHQRAANGVILGDNGRSLLPRNCDNLNQRWLDGGGRR